MANGMITMVDKDTLIKRIIDYRMKGWIKIGYTRDYLKLVKHRPLIAIYFLDYIKKKELDKNVWDRCIFAGSFILFILACAHMAYDIYYNIPQDTSFHIIRLLFMLSSICLMNVLHNLHT